jgi:hypothetical protein
MAGNLAQFAYRPKSTEVVAYTGTAGNGTAIPVGIHAVHVVTTTAAFIKIGKTAVATVNDIPCPALGTGYIFGVSEGDRVSAIQSAAGGNVHITLLTRC